MASSQELTSSSRWAVSRLGVSRQIQGPHPLSLDGGAASEAPASCRGNHHAGLTPHCALSCSRLADRRSATTEARHSQKERPLALSSTVPGSRPGSAAKLAIKARRCPLSLPLPAAVVRRACAAVVRPGTGSRRRRTMAVTVPLRESPEGRTEPPGLLLCPISGEASRWV